MWIESLRVRGLGRFGRTLEIDFDPRLTVVTGGNESGKTTLTAALFGALFGFDAEAGGLAAPPFSDGTAQAEVRFRVGKRRFGVIRDFLLERATLAEAPATDAGGGGKRGNGAPRVLFEGRVREPAEREAFGAALEAVLGVAGGAPWSRAGFVLDGAMDTTLDESVRAWMSGNPRGEHETVLARLRAERAQLLGGPPGRPGALDEVREELAQRRREAEAWDTEAAALRDRWETLSSSAIELEALRSDAHGHEEMIQNLERFDELTRDRARLEEQLLALRQEQDRIRKQVEAAEAGEALLERDFIDFLDAPGDVEDCLQTWTEVAARRRDLERDLENAETSVAELPRVRTRRNGSIAAGAAALLGFLACVGAGAPVVGLILLPVFAGAAYGAVWYLDRNATRLRMSRENEMVRLGAEMEEVQARERDAKAGLGRLAGFGDPATLRTEFKRYAEARGAIDRARSARDSHRPLSEVMEAYEQVFRELQVLDTQTRDLVARARYLSGLDANQQVLAAELEATRTRAAAALERLDTRGSELEEMRAEIARRESGLPSPGRLAEDLRRLEARERDLSERAEALELSATSLEAAVRGYQEGHLDRVAARAGEALMSFSRGRYDRIRFGAGLAPEARAENGVWVEALALSAATRDQMLLAVRLAVNEEVSGDRGLPVVLDAVFRAWDDARLEEARRVLDGLARNGRQVVLFTADPRLAGWAERTVSLADPLEEGRDARSRAA